MSKDCCCEENRSNNSFSFVFGIVIGAIIGAIIAILIYRNDKNNVIGKLQAKLEEFFRNLTGNLIQKEEKIVKKLKKSTKPIASETKKIVEDVIQKTKKPAPKMFVKPKR